MNIAAMTRRWQIALHLRFDDEGREAAFRADASRRFYRFVPPMIALAAGTFALFGIWDFADGLDSSMRTAFRFMVAVPIVLAFFALTFLSGVRGRMQEFLSAFLVTLSLLVVIQFHLLEGGPYGLSSGTAPLNFALIITFCLLMLPFTAVGALIAGACSVVIYFLAARTMVKAESALLGYVFNVQFVWVACVFACYVRERFLRREFLAMAHLSEESEKLGRFLSAYLPARAIDRVTLEPRPSRP